MKNEFRKNVQVFHLLSFPNGKSFECNVWRGKTTDNGFFYVGCVIMNGKEEQYYMQMDQDSKNYIFQDEVIPEQLKAIEVRISRQIQEFEMGTGSTAWAGRRRVQ